MGSKSSFFIRYDGGTVEKLAWLIYGTSYYKDFIYLFIYFILNLFFVTQNEGYKNGQVTLTWIKTSASMYVFSDTKKNVKTRFRIWMEFSTWFV